MSFRFSFQNIAVEITKLILSQAYCTFKYNELLDQLNGVVNLFPQNKLERENEESLITLNRK